MMPKRNPWLRTFIAEWLDIKNEVYEGEAGLQLSINSTCEKERTKMFGGSAHTLQDIGKIMAGMPGPRGRKITLNFAVADYEIDPQVLIKYFSPRDYVIKLTPMHNTTTAEKNGIKTPGSQTEYWPFEKYEEDLKSWGYDVIVFLASEYEDAGRITCGNAILSGTMPEVDHKVIIPRPRCL